MNKDQRKPGIRDRVIGQQRGQKHRAWESPDQQDRFAFGAKSALPLVPTLRRRPGMGYETACAGCGRTKDLWEENNGEGLSKAGRRFCCKPCATGEGCTCVEQDARKGQQLNSLSRRALRRKR